MAPTSSETRSASTASGCTPLTKVIVWLCVGLLMCIIGIVSYTTFEPILENQVKANLVIDEANEVYDSWKEAPIPIYVKLYLFNYTDVEQFLDSGAKPKLAQVGPFVYRERRRKFNISFNDDEVTYHQRVSYEFLPHMTVGSLDDEIMTPNVPFIAAAYKNRLAGVNEEAVAETMNDLFKQFGSTVFVKRKVGELLFDGYSDRMLSMARSMGWSSFDRFGWQIGRNNSNDGRYTINTGAKNMNRYGKVENWNGLNKTQGGFRRYCNYINGTTGEMWPPYSIDANTTELTFFVPNLCRSLNLTFLQAQEVKKIKVSRFHLAAKMFDYSLPQNQCFCPKYLKVATCPRKGVWDLNICQKDAPLVASLPHLLYADSAVIDAVEGLQPNESEHSFYMDIEPRMGIPVRVSAKLQMNVILKKFKYFDTFANFSDIYLPAFWIETTATVDDGLAFKIRLVTEDLANYVTMAASAWVFLGLFIIMCTLAYTIAHTRRTRKERASGTYTAVKLVRTGH